MAPRTDSSASRFWGGTIAVFPFVAKWSLSCAGNNSAGGPSFLSKSGYGPGGFPFAPIWN